MNISVIGLGKLGLCTAACFASSGHKVIGVDNNLNTISQLQAGQCPINETGLEGLLKQSRHNLTFTENINSAVRCSEIILIIVPTPSEQDGRFTNKYITKVLESVGPVLNQNSKFKVVDVVSTVMPGSCDEYFRPLLEKLSGKVCGKDFGLVYNPEFIALGSVIEHFLNPDMVLVGATDSRSAKMVQQLYVSTCRNHPHIAVMSCVNAEIAKLSLNCFVTMKISFANELASICEKIKGADVDVITEAIGRDSRIGSKYLKAGLGFGGPCFPRDNLAFQAFAKEAGVETKLGPQVVAINKSIVNRLLEIIRKDIKPGEKIAVLGMSYKPGTHIIEESQSLMLANELIKAGYEVAVHDPQALDSVRSELNESVKCENDIYQCARNAAAIVLMTNWPEYANLDWEKTQRQVKEGAILLDSWRIYKNVSFQKLRYVPLGICINNDKRENDEIILEGCYRRS